MTVGCQNQITEISTELSKNDFEGADSFGDKLTEIALSVKSGNIAFDIDKVNSFYAEFSITASSEDLLPEVEELEETVSVALKFKVSLDSDGDAQFDTEEVLKTVGVGVAVAVAAVACISLLEEGIIVTIIKVFSSAFGLIGKLILEIAK